MIRQNADIILCALGALAAWPLAASLGWWLIAVAGGALVIVWGRRPR